MRSRLALCALALTAVLSAEASAASRRTTVLLIPVDRNSGGAAMRFTEYIEGAVGRRSGYVLKEAPHQTLVRAIEKVAQGEGYVDPALMEYAVRLATATRAPGAHGMPELDKYITYGASPRASINLILTARALAFVRGRDYALPQDVLDMARDVMRHRLVLSFEALSDNVTADDVLSTVLKRIPVPVVPLRERSNVRARA